MRPTSTRVPPARTTLDAEGTKELAAWISIGWKRDQGLRQRWDYWRDLLVGEFRRQGYTGAFRNFASGPDGSDSAAPDINRLTLNLIYLHTRTLVPTVFAKDPYIDALPPTESDAPNAPIWEALINNLLPLMKFKKEAKKITTDAIVFGEGWGKLGWSGRLTHEDDSGLPGGNGTAQSKAPDFFQQALQLAGLQVGEAVAPPAPRAKRQRIAPTSSEAGGMPVTYLMRDGPFIARLPPHAVVVDPLSADRDPATARFIAVRYLKPIQEIRATPGYDVPEKLDQTKLLNTQSSPYSWLADGSDRTGVSQHIEFPSTLGLAVLWEVWVYQLVDLGLYRQVITLVEGADRPIRMVSWDKLLGSNHIGYPFKRLVFNEVPDEVPMSEYEGWADIQMMINWLVRKALLNVNRFAQITLVNEKAFTETQKAVQEIKLGADGAIIKVKGSVEGVAKALEFPHSSSDANAMLSLLIDMADKISGISENRKGESGARTATEARIIEGGASVKISERLDSVEDFCIECVYTLISLLQAFVDRKYVIQRTGSGGAVEWMHFGPDQLSGEVPSIKIRFESTKFGNMQRDLQKWSAAMNWLMQLKPLMPDLRLDIALGHALRALGIDNVSELMGMPIVSDQSEQQWVEICMMLAGMPVQASPDEPAQLHMQVIDKYKATAAYAHLVETGSPIVQLIDDHYMQHQQFLDMAKQAQVDASKKGAQTAVDLASGNEESPANQARGEAQENVPETPAPAMAGASNER